MYEYWGHEASLLPVELHRLLRWRQTAAQPGPRTKAMLAEHPDYLSSVLEEISARGPLTVSDLSDPGTRTGPWWGHGKGKVALDWLFARGQITAYRNGSFTRIYDLTERVIAPEHLNAPAADRDEAYRELLLRSARHHGVGTAADLSDYYRLHGPTARKFLAEMVAAGELEEVRVEGWTQPTFMHPEAKRPRGIAATALLSPFDPVVWKRDRTERLFGFFYRIEIYVPKSDRVYGYYVLPFLMDDGLVARVDLKSDRKDGLLLVRGAFTEAGIDVEEVAVRLAPELVAMSGWLGLGEVAVHDNGDLAPVLGRQLGAV
jgi:hypothetical protein